MIQNFKKLLLFELKLLFDIDSQQILIIIVRLMQKQKEYSNKRIKLFIIGDSSVGKTNMMFRLAKDQYFQYVVQAQNNLAKGQILIIALVLGCSLLCKIHIHDQKDIEISICYPIDLLLMSNQPNLLMIQQALADIENHSYDITRENSFQSIKTYWYPSLKKLIPSNPITFTDINYIISHIFINFLQRLVRKYSNSNEDKSMLVYMLIGNKVDLLLERNIDNKMIEAFAGQNKMIHSQISLQTRENLQQTTQIILKSLGIDGKMTYKKHLLSFQIEIPKKQQRQ